jgi:signal transduction histidine kinase
VGEQLVGAEIEQSELKRKMHLLNILIYSLAGALGIFLVIVLVLRLPSLTSSTISIFSALVICGVAYWLNRSGKFYPAAYLFLGGFIIVANISVLLPSIPLETRVVGPLFYSLSVVAAGVLIAPVAAFYCAGFGAATLLIITASLGGGTAFTLSGDSGLGWAVVSVPILLSLVLASISWLFGESINNAFSALKKRSEELQASHEELEAANEELRTTEEELRTSNEELQTTNEKLIETQEQLIRSEKLAAIGQLASGVGHELRNPLGSIKNATFYVRKRLANTDLPASEPRVVEFLNIIDDEVNSANKVITDLLGFSRVAKPAVSPASIAGIIEDALRYTPVPENVKLTKNINNNLPSVMVDADQIKQVFLNIALNALQAMPEGGHLDIRASSKGEFAEVEFTDSGDGIPKSIINKIFDPLFTTKAKGVGLGLSVCKSIIDRHEGDIRVESEEGKGTTFTLSLPTNKF